MTAPDRLTALAVAWETWATEASTLAGLVDDDGTRTVLRAKAEQRIEDATALRNLAADLKET